MPSQQFGFKGDFFSEVLHRLRGESRYADFVKAHLQSNGCNDLRDRKAITRLACAYLKLLFPNLTISTQQFLIYCVEPAIEMRQRIRDELQKLDAEFRSVAIMPGEMLLP